MKPRSVVLLATAGCIAAACVPQDERDLYRPGAYVNEGVGLKAFADAVLAHCVPAIQNEEDFAAFEMKNATPVRALAKNKYSIVSEETLPVWQMAEGLIQIQLTPYTNCEVAAVGMPMDTAIDVVARAAKASGFTEAATSEATADASMHRLLVSGTGTTIDLSGPVEGQTPDGRTYTKLVANVSKAGN